MVYTTHTKKKILFIMHSMPIGGAEKVLLDILKQFDYTVYEVDLLLYFNYGEYLNLIPSAVHIRYLFKQPQLTFRDRVKRKVIKVFHLTDIIEKYAIHKEIGEKQYYCIISFCQGFAHKLHLYIINQTKHNISWVHTDMQPDNWGKINFGNSLKKQEVAYNQMDTIVFVSKQAQANFNKTFKINNNIKQICLYNLIDVNNIKKLANSFKVERDSNKTIFLNVGRLVDVKMQNRLVSAANLLKNEYKNFEIWIIGEGSLRSQLEQQIRKEDVSEYVKLLGKKVNPYPYFKVSDIFLLTSKLEGLPIVICEALSLSLPVISTKVTGPIELLHNSEFGVLVSEDIHEIKDAMYKMATDEKWRNHYKMMAEERIKSFDVNQTMRQIYRIIE